MDQPIDSSSGAGGTRLQQIRAEFDPTVEKTRIRFARWFLAVVFLLAGVAKLGGATAVEQTFARFGYSSDFMFLIGLVETAGGLALLVPSLALLSSVILSGVMLGAIVSHLTHDPAVMALPAVLVMLVLGAIARQHERIRRAVRQRRSEGHPGDVVDLHAKVETIADESISPDSAVPRAKSAFGRKPSGGAASFASRPSEASIRIARLQEWARAQAIKVAESSWT